MLVVPLPFYGIPEVPAPFVRVGYGGKTGRHLLAKSSSQFDRLRTSAAEGVSRAGTPHLGVGRGGNSHPYSEQFRSAHKTCRPLYGRLNVQVD
jgi:hypothetical protein